MIRAVLFDVDGTLIDSNAMHVATWARVFREAGRDVPDAAIAEQIGKGGDNLVPALLPGASEKWDPLESTCRHASLSIL